MYYRSLCFQLYGSFGSVDVHVIFKEVKIAGNSRGYMQYLSDIIRVFRRYANVVPPQLWNTKTLTNRLAGIHSIFGLGGLPIRCALGMCCGFLTGYQHSSDN